LPRCGLLIGRGTLGAGLFSVNRAPWPRSLWLIALAQGKAQNVKAAWDFLSRAGRGFRPCRLGRWGRCDGRGGNSDEPNASSETGSKSPLGWPYNGSGGQKNVSAANMGLAPTPAPAGRWVCKGKEAEKNGNMRMDAMAGASSSDSLPHKHPAGSHKGHSHPPARMTGTTNTSSWPMAHWGNVIA